MFEPMTILLAVAVPMAVALGAPVHAQQAPDVSRSQVRQSDAVAEVERRMAAMEAALSKAEAQVDRINRTQDAAERERLWREHARTMRENARALQAIGEPFNRAMGPMMGGDSRNASSEAMMKAHALIARRIALMDRMMGQMMELLMRHQERP